MKDRSRRRSEVPAPSSDAARNRMRAAKPRNTKPEVILRSALDQCGLQYANDVILLPGLRRKTDIVFEAERVAVYVDGCFWHGCPIHGTWPKQNAEFWRNKIETNRRRDVDTDQKLMEAGWRVIRVWEHENMMDASQRIATTVRDAARGSIDD